MVYLKHCLTYLIKESSLHIKTFRYTDNNEVDLTNKEIRQLSPESFE